MCSGTTVPCAEWRVATRATLGMISNGYDGLRARHLPADRDYARRDFAGWLLSLLFDWVKVNPDGDAFTINTVFVSFPCENVGENVMVSWRFGCDPGGSACRAARAAAAPFCCYPAAPLPYR